jgi:hypothetical protein
MTWRAHQSDTQQLRQFANLGVIPRETNWGMLQVNRVGDRRS